jgi:Family of unknown function (DUF6035)
VVGIPVVLDNLTAANIAVAGLLHPDSNDISALRNRIQQERKKSSNRYVCGFCKDPVYVSNSQGTPHFAHYASSGLICPWHTISSQKLRDISAQRFQGRQVSDLHVRLVLAIENFLLRSPVVSNVGSPDQTYFGAFNTGHRYPDLRANYCGHDLVFEVQLSSTYLPVISDREDFYRKNRAFLIWVFHDFKGTIGRQTEKDILALRSRQVFELDDEAIKLSLDADKLMVKCHWQASEIVDGKANWCWKEKFISLDELKFDDYLIEARFVDPWQIESQLLRNIYSSTIDRFEKYWFDRHAIHEKFIRNEMKRSESGLPWREKFTSNAIMGRAFKTLIEISGGTSSDISIIQKLNLDAVLDRLFFIRDGKNSFNQQSLIGGVHTVLDRFPQFTDALAATLFAYNQVELLKVKSISNKVLKLLNGDKAVPQCHDYDRFLGMLFPEAASYIRNSCVPYVLQQSAS